jgi:hypothetical protein
MKTKKCLLLSVFFLFSLQGFSQCFYAFKDTMNSWQYWAFEDGEYHLAEKLETSRQQLGWDYSVYIDKFQNFRYFKFGTNNRIQEFPPSFFQATDHLLIWENAGGLLYAFSDGQTHQLGKWVGRNNYVFGDSIVAFTDNFGYLQIFYKNKLHQIENYTIESLKAADNLVAYVTANQLFEVFHQGETFTLEDGNPPTSFQVNRNIVAYVDYMGVFKVYWNGEVFDLMSFQPKKYITGEDFVVFISPLNEFKVFYNGEVKELLSYIPSHYEVIENILVYYDRANFFNVFYKGKQQTLEYFIPKSYKADNNMLAYPDLDGYLNAYDHGEKKRIGNVIARQYDVHNGTVFYWQNPSQVNCFCKGKNYPFQLGY